MTGMRVRPLLACLLASACMLLGGCDPITMGLVTASGGMAVNHQMSSTISRTFSEQQDVVHEALLDALHHMSIDVGKEVQGQNVDTLEATAGTRKISLRVEPVTRTSTLLEVAVHQDLLTMDGATAREIVAQTEYALERAHGTRHPAAADAARTGPGSAGSTAADASDALPGKTTYFGYDRERKPVAAKPRSHPGQTPGQSLGQGTGGQGA